MDNILIGFAPLAGFSASRWGVLKYAAGKHDLDRPRAFNQARAVLDVGINYERVLRRGIWGLPVGVPVFDWEDPGYWPLFREWLTILHQPVQGIPRGPGADVLVEIFDGCSESWMYSDYAKAKRLILAMFANLGDLSWIKFGVGNELNKPDSVEFVKNAVYPVFKSAGLVPFSFGATYSRNHDLLELQKKAAGALWGDDPVKRIYRQVHGVRDEKSENLLDAMYYYLEHQRGLCCILGCDGVKDGASDCDDDGDGGKVRPSVTQLRALTKYILTRTIDFFLPGGHRKVGIEYTPSGIYNNPCHSRAIAAVSTEYEIFFGAWPANYGKYTEDWIEPEPPEPPTPPLPPTPPTPPTPPIKPCSYFLKRLNILGWLRCVLFGKH